MVGIYYSIFFVVFGQICYVSFWNGVFNCYVEVVEGECINQSCQVFGVGKGQGS